MNNPLKGPQPFDSEGEGYQDTISARGEVLKQALIARYRDHASLPEYISEAEHQDGPGYWDQFATAEDLYYDFDLFVTFRSDA